MGFFGFILTLGVSASKGSSSSSFPISTSARDSLIGSMSSPIGATSRFRVFVGLTSVHVVGLCGFHSSVQVEIENVVVEIDWNDFVLSMAVHQFLKMNSHSLTNFAVIRNRVTTRHVPGRNTVVL